MHAPTHKHQHTHGALEQKFGLMNLTCFACCKTVPQFPLPSAVKADQITPTPDGKAALYCAKVPP